MKSRILFLTGFIFMILFTGACFSAHTKIKPSPSPTPIPSPLPLVSPVAPDKLINPIEGLGKVKFGVTINDVEKELGRGEIRPLESDFQGNNSTELVYKDTGLTFKFGNGLLAMIVIDKSGYATPSGVQVGCDIGDLIREFGAKYTINRSLLQEEDPTTQEFTITYENIAANVKGKIIKSISIRMTKKNRHRQ